MSIADLSTAQAMIGQGGYIDCIWGDIRELNDVSELDNLAGSYLVVLPIRAAQARQACLSPAERHSSAPIITITVQAEQRLSRQRLLHRLLDVTPAVNDLRYEPPDSEYGELVERIIDEDIAGGRGSNFVIPRSLVGQLGGNTVTGQHSIFKRLLQMEPEAYMTYWCNLGESVLIGASPEMHVRKDASGTITMNPISGTYTHEDSGPTVEGVRAFLADEKERDELHMVVDEELKILSSICDAPPVVEGPFTKEMSRVTHAEYYLTGHTSETVSKILRNSMFAPTVLGSPVESAFSVAADRDVIARRYFGGVLGRVDHHNHGTSLDSAILIRTLEIEGNGHLRYPVGATLVRDSTAASEVKETIGKTSGILTALTEPREGGCGQPGEDLLNERRAGLAPFWTMPDAELHPVLSGRVVIVDHEDNSTWMLAKMLEQLGLAVSVDPDPGLCDAEAADLLILGPGPGDPHDRTDPRMIKARRWAETAVSGRFTRVLAVCLSHQLVCETLGIHVRRLPQPNQGRQASVQLWGEDRCLAFYNSFAGFVNPRFGLRVHEWQEALDEASGEIFGLKKPGFETMQFHPESVLSIDGKTVLTDALKRLFQSRVGE